MLKKREKREPNQRNVTLKSAGCTFYHLFIYFLNRYYVLTVEHETDKL